MLVAVGGCCPLLGRCSLLVAISSGLSGFFPVYLLLCCGCSSCCWLGAGSALLSSVLWLMALVVLHLSWPWTMFHLSMLCSASSFVGCVQRCVGSPQTLLLCYRACVLLFSYNPQACPLELDMIGLACTLLFVWLCEVSASTLDCCMSTCRVDVSPIVFLLASVWWVILLLWFLVVCHVRPACSWMVFLCCSQVGSMFLPLLVALLQTHLGVWLLASRWGELWSLVLSVLLLTGLVVKPNKRRTESQSVDCFHWSCRPICTHRLQWGLDLLFWGLASLVLVCHMFVLLRQTRLGKHVLPLHRRSSAHPCWDLSSCSCLVLLLSCCLRYCDRSNLHCWGCI